MAYNHTRHCVPARIVPILRLQNVLYRTVVCSARVKNSMQIIVCCDVVNLYWLYRCCLTCIIRIKASCISAIWVDSTMYRGGLLGISELTP